MKIALIAPPYPLSESPSPPLGLSYVAAACEAAGADVLFLDFIVQKYSPEKLAEALTAFEPDAVGVTSVTMNFKQAVRILQDARRICPETVTMMGGPHVSFDIENTLNQYPELDLIVCGEGEATLEELVPLLKHPDEWKHIRGVAFRNNGVVFKTPERSLISNLDDLPLPARHFLPMSRYQALGFPVTIITTRGCPNQCIFCLGRRMVGQRPRFRDPSLVVDEIEQILSFGMTRINIADDLFTASKKRVKALCREIIKRRIHVEWSAFARVNTVSPEILAIMREAGCDTISFGIESGNPEMLKRVKKGITLEQARQAVAWTREAGMRVHASFMVGLPGETLETMQETKEFAESLDIEYGFHFLSPFPGTTLCEEINSYDLEILTQDWDLYDANQAIVKTSHLEPEHMNAFVEEAYQPFFQKAKACEERYHSGNYSDDDFLMTEGKYRMNLIYKMLSEDMVSDHLLSPVTGCSPETALINHITLLSNMDAPVVERTVKSLIDAGYIKSETCSNGRLWYWTHNNRSDRAVAYASPPL